MIRRTGAVAALALLGLAGSVQQAAAGPMWVTFSGSLTIRFDYSTRQAQAINESFTGIVIFDTDTPPADPNKVDSTRPDSAANYFGVSDVTTSHSGETIGAFPAGTFPENVSWGVYFEAPSPESLFLAVSSRRFDDATTSSWAHTELNGALGTARLPATFGGSLDAYLSAALVEQGSFFFLDYAYVDTYELRDGQRVLMGSVGHGLLGEARLTGFGVGDPIAPVPEPGTMLLLGSGIAGVVVKRYRRRNAAQRSV